MGRWLDKQIILFMKGTVWCVDLIACLEFVLVLVLFLVVLMLMLFFKKVLLSPPSMMLVVSRESLIQKHVTALLGKDGGRFKHFLKSKANCHIIPVCDV